MKRARMLLRVSSNQQLEADGDLGIQRQLVKEYIEKQSQWILDAKEYFEGSNSGYKNAVEDRDVLQEALKDAEAGEYDILVAYKDDRIGRRMWEIGTYVMSLKSYNVTIYTVKDGCISPESNDIMGQMMLALRYGNAQKSSSDTGMRVKDTAQKLVQQGKFMGGKAPYGYRFELSGELSKHGRALHKLVIVEEEAEIVRYIYELSMNRAYGSAKIAKVLNLDARFWKMAPGEGWKAGTITSILTNPVYCGYVAYKRREKVNGKYHKLDSREWIKAKEPNHDIVIIEEVCWNRVQEERQRRNKKYTRSLENQGYTIIQKNDGKLSLIDVIYCGYCGSKLTNGTKYNYWTIKGTGEKKTSLSTMYKCQNAWAGVPHCKTRQFRAEKIEEIVFLYIAKYIDTIKNDDEIIDMIRKNSSKERMKLEKEIRQNQEEIQNLKKGINKMEEVIPQAMEGHYPLTLEELANLIRKQKEKVESLVQKTTFIKEQLEAACVDEKEWEEIKKKIPTWKQVFLESDAALKRVLVGKLIERIEVTREEIKVRFRINRNEFLPMER